MNKSKMFGVVVLLLLASFASAAFAQCYARMFNGQGEVVQVRERQGMTPFWAQASWDMDGWPTITYSPPFFQLQPIMQELTKIHECMHLSIPTVNEFEANCSALRVMRERGLGAAEEDYIGQIHYSIGPLGPQYGGSGMAFWNGTIQMCGPNMGGGPAPIVR